MAIATGRSPIPSGSSGDWRRTSKTWLRKRWRDVKKELFKKAAAGRSVETSKRNDRTGFALGLF